MADNSKQWWVRDKNQKSIDIRTINLLRIMKKFILPLLCLLTFSAGSTAFAAKEVFQRSKPHVNVGTLGQTDDIKLALSVALAENSEPGLPGVVVYLDINNNSPLEAFLVEVETDTIDYDIFDFYGQDTIDNMLYGGVEQDGAILVVSAADGPMPQTREHILLARQVGVPAMVVFLDLDGVIDAGQIERAEKETRSLLSEAGYRGDLIPVIRGSAIRALRGDTEAMEALTDLRDALDQRVPLR